MSEVTTLPTEPQPLPEVIKLFVYRSSLRRALEHFARIPWVSIFIFDQLKVVVYPTPRRPSAPSHSKATIGAMHILSFITQNQLIIFTSNSKVDNIEVLSRVQSYLVLIHHTYDLTSYLLSTYIPTYLPTYLLTSRTIKVFYTLYFIQCDQIWRFFKVPCKSSQKN